MQCRRLTVARCLSNFEAAMLHARNQQEALSQANVQIQTASKPAANQ